MKVIKDYGWIVLVEYNGALIYTIKVYGKPYLKPFQENKLKPVKKVGIDIIELRGRGATVEYTDEFVARYRGLVSVDDSGVRFHVRNLKKLEVVAFWPIFGRKDDIAFLVHAKNGIFYVIGNIFNIFEWEIRPVEMWEGFFVIGNEMFSRVPVYNGIFTDVTVWDGPFEDDEEDEKQKRIERKKYITIKCGNDEAYYEVRNHGTMLLYSLIEGDEILPPVLLVKKHRNFLPLEGYEVTEDGRIKKWSLEKRVDEVMVE
jgi:hypothetical protein